MFFTLWQPTTISTNQVMKEFTFFRPSRWGTVQLVYVDSYHSTIESPQALQLKRGINKLNSTQLGEHLNLIRVIVNYKKVLL